MDDDVVGELVDHAQAEPCAGDRVGRLCALVSDDERDRLLIDRGLEMERAASRPVGVADDVAAGPRMAVTGVPRSAAVCSSPFGISLTSGALAHN